MVRPESYIGQAGHGDNFKGAIEDFRIYKTDLTGDQIQNIAAYRQQKIDESENVNRLNQIAQAANFVDSEWTTGGNPRKSVDERTGQVTYWFNGDSWL